MFLVKLNMYDLSGGLAAQNSQAMVGVRMEGCWVSGIVVFDKEYYFGQGICYD